MDIFLLILSVILVIVGIIGAVVPVLPSIPLSLLGVLVFKFSDCCSYSWGWVIFFTILSIIVMFLDYYIPIYGAKKSGASKWGTYGAIIGMLIGLFFFPPFGFLIGSILGAFIGELIKNRNNVKGAFKSALGSFLGFLASSGVSLMVSSAMLALILLNISCSFK